jgi:hypothetical protein
MRGHLRPTESVCEVSHFRLYGSVHRRDAMDAYPILKPHASDQRRVIDVAAIQDQRGGSLALTASKQ